MSVYVDCAKHPYRGMLMSHMWADAPHELLAMADAIGLARRWLQKPPSASWLHFDICQRKRALAVAKGAIETDKYAPLEHVARLRGDQATLDRIARIRATFSSSDCRTHP
jgi:hypothetical protein